MSHINSHMWQYNVNLESKKKRDNMFFSYFNIQCQRFLSLQLISNAVNRFCFLLTKKNYKKWSKIIYNLIGSGELYVSANI